MPPTKARIKTVSNIKTRSGATRGDAELPHKTHMRICCLEMERHRRQQEREIALARAARCEERCEQIDAEVKALLAVMGLGARGSGPAIAPGREEPAVTVVSPRRGNITHRY